MFDDRIRFIIRIIGSRKKHNFRIITNWINRYRVAGPDALRKKERKKNIEQNNNVIKHFTVNLKI